MEILRATFLNLNLIFFVLILGNSCMVYGDLRGYINGITSYFGYNQENVDNTELYASEFTQKIPYEVSSVDEKFISEAVKLTGVAISELDSCQQRVVLKLKVHCHKMNDEQVAKMAVHLLNCQSYVEGRNIYPCTDEMSIKQCTTDMDSDTWTSYHLMSNRAKAVCYMIRQSQFRGLAEHTVNRLMEASKDQLRSLGRITHNQESIMNLAEDTYNTLSTAQEQLSDQQKDMQKAQMHGQLVLENNIMRLVDEKRLIHETHNQLIQMTKDVQNKLENSAKLIQDQNSESRDNHKELLDDIVLIQTSAEDLFKKIDAYSEILLKQNEAFKNQYEATLHNLQEVHKTVHTLVNLVGGTRQALEERLNWIMTALGGTDQAVERLYLVLWHVGFILTAMLACAFLSARSSTRLVVASLPPFNLAVALYGREYLDIISLSSVIGGFIIAQTVIISAINFRKTIPQAIAWSKKNLTPTKSEKSSSSRSNSSVHEPNVIRNNNYFQPNISRTFKNDLHENGNDDHSNDGSDHNETDNFNEDFQTLTPSVSRNGHYSGIRSRSRSNTPLLINSSLKGACHAKTKAGTPCKLSSLPGREFCYRHQSGDSIMG